MKKIIATVLAMVMALALCTTAFAATVEYTAVDQNGKATHTEARIYGEIIREKKGENGFGYDPIFFVPEYGKTTAELSVEEKNAISHRGKALRELKEILWS